MEISEFSTISCRGRVVKALDSKSNGVSPHRFESCRLRYIFTKLCQNEPRVSWRHVGWWHSCHLTQYCESEAGVTPAPPTVLPHTTPSTFSGRNIDNSWPRTLWETEMRLTKEINQGYQAEILLYFYLYLITDMIKRKSWTNLHLLFSLDTLMLITIMNMIRLSTFETYEKFTYN